MADNTSIEWADATVNLAWGCTKVSAGCENCYAERLSRWEPFSFHFLNYANQVKKIQSMKKPRKIFLNSMSDTFHEKIGFDVLDIWFDMMKSFPQHTFIVLTKRIGRAFQYFKSGYPRYVPDNVWLGTSVEDQWHTFRIDTLRKINAQIKFISFEPLLGPIKNLKLNNIQWAIVGGESDYKHPRPMADEWVADILKQCREYGVPFFYKQKGGKIKDEEGHWGTNKLNGISYQEFPRVRNFYHTDSRVQTKLVVDQ